MLPITRECIVCNLQIGIWQGYRLDKDATKRVTEEAGAKLDAARINKALIPKKALAPIVTASSSIRTHFYNHTLPWKDNGDRLLTRRSYPEFVKEHEELHEHFKWDVDHFIDKVYPRAKAQAEFRMGEFYNEADYPSQSELRRRFYVRLELDAVGAANDFHVRLDGDASDAVRGAMEHQLQQRILRAAGDVWQRFYDTLDHFATKMEGENIFRDTTVTNLQQLVKVLPELNVLDDANLEKIRVIVETELARYSPAELRKEPLAREAARERALEILDHMRGYMVAFQHR